MLWLSLTFSLEKNEFEDHRKGKGGVLEKITTLSSPWSEKTHVCKRVQN